MSYLPLICLIFGCGLAFFLAFRLPRFSFLTGWILGALIVFVGLTIVGEQPNAAIDTAFPGDPGRAGEIGTVLAGYAGRVIGTLFLTLIPALLGMLVGRRKRHRVSAPNEAANRLPSRPI